MSDSPKLRGTLVGRIGSDATVYANPELNEAEKQAWRDAVGEGKNIECGSPILFSRALTAQELCELNEYVAKKYNP